MEATPPANNSNSNSNNDMDDIQYLLHLEAIKRYKDDEKEMHRQVEEQARIYMDAKREYQREYARLANLNKQLLLSDALQAPQTQINDTQVDDTIRKLSTSSAILSRTSRPTELDVRVLEECKEQLQRQHCKPRDQLAQYQRNFAENRETLKSVCSTLDNVEKNFEKATLVAMDQYIKEMQTP
ncbi:augmin complex subunit dgt4 [Drosophila albomicans]|uniref:Augmin complex subunit dgt4 n=1 Tax=Drosophila albomicans TaxID=7291 RepID=A0A6P8XQX3_DROAB|nr:augmin complex subunit dgt4 [Drosophila albomicans]